MLWDKIKFRFVEIRGGGNVRKNGLEESIVIRKYFWRRYFQERKDFYIYILGRLVRIVVLYFFRIIVVMYFCFGF